MCWESCMTRHTCSSTVACRVPYHVAQTGRHGQLACIELRWGHCCCCVWLDCIDWQPLGCEVSYGRLAEKACMMSSAWLCWYLMQVSKRPCSSASLCGLVASMLGHARQPCAQHVTAAAHPLPAWSLAA